MAAGSSPPYGRLSETVVMGRGPWLVVVIGCKTRFTLVSDPDNHIRIAHVGYPDVLWSGRIYGIRPDVYAFPRTFLPVIFVFATTTFLLQNSSRYVHFAFVFPFVALVVCWLRSCLSWVSIKLGLKNVFKAESYFIWEDVVSTEKAEQDTILFSKEQFNAGLRFSLPALFKEFLHFTQIPPAFIHPNIVRVLMECNIINMLYNLDLMLLEVFFVYSLKKVKNDIFSMSAHLPSLQLVTELPDSTKGGAKGLVVVRGAWARSKHPARPFSPNYSLVIPGPERRGHIVDWVERASFACLNKLFEIDAKERHYKTLLSAQNLMAVVRESQDYVINILPRKLPKEVVPGEHYTVKDLPIYQEFKEVDAEKRRALLDDREKRKNEGTLQKAPGQKRGAASPLKKAPAKKRKLVKNGKGVKEPTPPKIFALPPITHEAEVIIEEPVNPAPHSISSGPGHVAGLNHSSTSLAVVARLANLAEEAASINHPGSPNLGVDAAEAVCATPMEEAGAESQSQPSDDPDRLTLVLVKGPPSKRPRSACNLRSGLIGRLQDRQQEIEVSCSSAYDTHPEGAK
ncbi:hypothetical protein CK203_026528 [Vitis vinifera]|uniref:Uncharacterized protein n=1 Tax=Vitis vinifera TaxID=29760 RepID=A0A438IVM2_VITVI|nr:hypothetical protein CK203_026528 [Vitis vinifera]